MARERIVLVAFLLLAGAARAEVPLDETTLPLRLVGTVVSARADRSLAVIQSGASTHVVHRGESIGGARVEEIAKDGIVLEHGSRLERLSFGKPSASPSYADASTELARAHSNTGAADAGPDSEARARAPRPAAVRGRALARKAAVQRASFSKPRTNDDVLADLSKQARFQPLLDGDGKLRGVALLGIVPDSMLERFGLESGDVVTHVAGVKIDNTANAYNTLRGLNLRNGVAVTVLRRGAVTTVQVPGGAF